MIQPIKSFVWATKIMIVISIFFFGYIAVSKIYAKYVYLQIHKKHIVYVYAAFHQHNLNNALYVSRLELGSSLKQYYEAEIKGVNPEIPVPIKYAPILKPVFSLGAVAQDSTLIEFIDVDTCCWGYIHGYVYSETVHLTPPEDSLLEKYIRAKTKSESIHTFDKVYQQPSEYGIYCN